MFTMPRWLLKQSVSLCAMLLSECYAILLFTDLVFDFEIVHYQVKLTNDKYHRLGILGEMYKASKWGNVWLSKCC